MRKFFSYFKYILKGIGSLFAPKALAKPSRRRYRARKYDYRNYLPDAKSNGLQRDVEALNGDRDKCMKDLEEAIRKTTLVK